MLKTLTFASLTLLALLNTNTSVLAYSQNIEFDAEILPGYQGIYLNSSWDSDEIYGVSINLSPDYDSYNEFQMTSFDVMDFSGKMQDWAVNLTLSDFYHEETSVALTEYIDEYELQFDYDKISPRSGGGPHMFNDGALLVPRTGKINFSFNETIEMLNTSQPDTEEVYGDFNPIASGAFMYMLDSGFISLNGSNTDYIRALAGTYRGIATFDFLNAPN